MLELSPSISVSSTVANNTIINIDNIPDRTGSMYIFVHGPSREYVDETMDCILSEVYRLHNELDKEIVPHTITIVGVQKNVDSDNAIREQQNNRVANIRNLQDQIATYNNSLDVIATDLGLTDKTVLISYIRTHEFFWKYITIFIRSLHCCNSIFI